MAKHLWYERSHRIIHVLPNLSPRLVMALELGSHPKPTQIADALVKDGLAVEAEGVLVQVSQHPLYSFFI